MMHIVKEEGERLKGLNLKDLEMQVGINTGKIIGCIIGTKMVRYDIFGQDVFISNLVMRKAPSGVLCVSDSTRRMIKRKTFVYDTFDWQDHISFIVPGTDTRVTAFAVEEIFVDVNSSMFSEKEKMETEGGNAGETFEV